MPIAVKANYQIDALYFDFPDSGPVLTVKCSLVVLGGNTVTIPLADTLYSGQQLTDLLSTAKSDLTSLQEAIYTALQSTNKVVVIS